MNNKKSGVKVLAPRTPPRDTLTRQLKSNLRKINELNKEINDINNQINSIKINAYDEINQTLFPINQNNIVPSQKREPCTIIIDRNNENINLLSESINKIKIEIAELESKNNNIENKIKQMKPKRNSPQSSQQQTLRTPQQQQTLSKKPKILAPATPGGKAKPKAKSKTKSKAKSKSNKKN